MNNFWILNMGFVALLVGSGLYCLLTMKNTVKLLIGIEVIAKGVTLALVAGGFARENLMVAQSLAITWMDRSDRPVRLLRCMAPTG